MHFNINYKDKNLIIIVHIIYHVQIILNMHQIMLLVQPIIIRKNEQCQVFIIDLYNKCNKCMILGIRLEIWLGIQVGMRNLRNIVGNKR
jgi:hypothetical protein